MNTYQLSYDRAWTTINVMQKIHCDDVGNPVVFSFGVSFGVKEAKMSNSTPKSKYWDTGMDCLN